MEVVGKAAKEAPEEKKLKEQETQTEVESQEQECQTQEKPTRSFATQFEAVAVHSISIQARPYETLNFGVQTEAKKLFDLGIQVA